MTSSVAPIAPSISFPQTRPMVVKTIEIPNPIITACSALLSAFLLSLAPINRAIDAVTPAPSPMVNPRTKKNKGILKATAAIARPLIRPMNIMSTIVYSVWIPIPAMMGIANFQRALSGLSRNSFNRDSCFSSLVISNLNICKRPYYRNNECSHKPKCDCQR